MRAACPEGVHGGGFDGLVAAAMTATQGRLADTIDVFYSAADKASESAMAAHAYKRAVDDLYTGIGRELVRLCSSFVRG